jgi:para-nitrobenzyl esterase
VLALLASPAADGLFARAIAQSPALPLIADRETWRGAHTSSSNCSASAAELAALPQRALRRAAGAAAAARRPRPRWRTA